MAILGGIFSDYLHQPWEQARDMVKEEFEQLRISLQKIQSTVTVQLNLGDIQGDVTIVPRYIANTGTGNAPKWDQVNLASGVTGRVSLSRLPTASVSTLLGRGDSGGGDYQAITLGTNLTMDGTTLQAANTFPLTWVSGEVTSTFPTGYPNLTCIKHFHVDGSALLGEYNERMTSVPVVVAAAGNVVIPNTALVTDLPSDSSGTWDILYTLTISNLTGSQILQLDWLTTLSAGTSGGIDFSTDAPTVTAVAGTDLTWNTGTYAVQSAAGGVFVVYITCTMQYT